MDCLAQMGSDGLIVKLLVDSFSKNLDSHDLLRIDENRFLIQYFAAQKL